MSFLSRIVVSLVCSAISFAGAEPLLRGSAMILSSSKGVEITVPGSAAITPDSDSLPLPISGIFSVKAGLEDSLTLHASNRVNLLFEGGGFFSIERFEGQFDSKDGAQSRMIMGIRTGTLVIDSRLIDSESQLLVETPFGRVSGAGALWFVHIDLDVRTGIYTFTIACSEGKLRVIDLNQKVVNLYRGQRIAGAGSFQKPLIEVGENTEETRETFEDFEQLLRKYNFDDIDHSAMRENMSKVPLVAPIASSDAVSAQYGVSNKRPIIIDFVPRPSEIMPYRGEIPLPRILKEE